MSVPKHPENPSHSTLCSECQTFYASQTYNGLCSSCFKKGNTSKKIQIPPKVQNQKIIQNPTVEKIVEVKEQLQKNKKLCFACNKKVGLLGTQCKCCFVFCNTHRLPQYHNCKVNYRQKGQKELQKVVVKVNNGKIIQL